MMLGNAREAMEWGLPCGGRRGLRGAEARQCAACGLSAWGQTVAHPGLLCCAGVFVSLSQIYPVMNILVINGSPRRGGNVATMLDAMRCEAAGRGHSVTVVDIAGLHIAPCTGCMACRTRGDCVLPADDAHRVAGLLRSADAVIVGAPCYWGNMPGQLKVLFDRIVYAMMGEGKRGLPRPLHKGKRAIIVTACTTPWPFNRLFGQSAGTVRAIREILSYSGFGVVGTVQCAGTKGAPLVSGRRLRRCTRLVGRLEWR